MDSEFQEMKDIDFEKDMGYLLKWKIMYFFVERCLLLKSFDLLLWVTLTYFYGVPFFYGFQIAIFYPIMGYFWSKSQSPTKMGPQISFYGLPFC